MCTFAISALIGLGVGVLDTQGRVRGICVSCINTEYCINTEHMKHNMKMLAIKCRSTEHY